MDKKLETSCNTILNALKINLVTIQKDYKDKVIGEGESAKARNKYWQGKYTHSVTPSDNVPLTPDKTLAVVGEHASWNDIGVSLPVLMECGVEVHVYDGPNGIGYVLFGQAKSSGVKYIKSINVGNENYRDQNWITAKSAP